LGKAYEKKEDYTNAIKTYNEIAKISSASQWTVYGLRRAEGIRLTREKQLIKDWFFLGPFDNTEKKGIERLFIPETGGGAKTEYPGKDGTIVKWSRPFGYDDFGYVDLNTLFKSNDYVTAYALTYVYSYSTRTVQLRFGAEDGIKIWVNDKVAYESTPKGSAEVDDEIITIKLQKGWNKVLLKVVDIWGSWGFYFRITGLNSKPIDDLIFDPEKDNKRLKRVYGKIKIEKRFEFTKIATAYVVAISILLLGLYFTIANIYYKIKVNRMKEDFISNVSHELKTPIAAIKMLAETLKRGTVRSEEKKSQYYDMIVRESDRLTRFINKILNFSTIKKGSKIFYFEKSNIVETIKRAIHLYEDEMQDKSLKINFNTKSENIFANIDKDAFLQVILNLLDNAYKYSKNDKEITVNVKERETEVLIEIIDKGLGIAKDEIVKIFERFYRVDSNILKGTKGSGLGLAFARSIVESHKGKIAVMSDIDKGSKFTISLPIEKA